MSVRSRIVAGLVMGAIALVLLGVLLTAKWGPLTGGVASAITVCAMTALVASRSHSSRRAWAWMFILDGLLSAVLAVSSIAARGAPYFPGAGYEEEMRRAIGPMPPSGAFLGIALAATVVLAAILLITVGLWMFYHDRHQQRGAS